VSKLAPRFDVDPGTLISAIGTFSKTHPPIYLA
jgi:hypothetical protein